MELGRESGEETKISRELENKEVMGDGVYANRQAEGKQTHRKAGAERLCGMMSQERE